MKNEEIITYALVAVVALVLGYGASVYFGQSASGSQVSLANATGSTNVTVDDAKIAKLKTALEGVIKLQGGGDVKLNFVGATDNGQYIEVKFSDSTGNQMPPIPVSRDFQYLYQGATKIDDFATQVAAYLAQQNSGSGGSGTQLTPGVKSDRPKVELFVMSYCPYGAQMEKAMIPVQALLGGKADIYVKFVSYSLHGAKEVQENVRQYCINRDSPDKYWAYLSCFLEDGNANRCMANQSIDEASVASCMSSVYSQYGISDSSSSFPIYAAENSQYGVQGSPTLVVNGAVVQPDRSPEAVKQAICAAFNTPPAECSTALSSTSTTPGFGYEASAPASAPLSHSSSGGCSA